MKRQRTAAVPPGHFSPAAPRDVEGVLRLWAVAARAACAAPARLADIGGACDRVTAGLVAPEALAAAEARLAWRRFAGAAVRLMPERWPEAGRSLVDELDALGQRLDAMPLPAWERLPEGLDEVTPPPRATAPTAAGPLARAGEAAARLAALGTGERRALLRRLVASGTLDRGESVMVDQWLERGGELGPDDELLREVLERLHARLP